MLLKYSKSEIQKIIDNYREIIEIHDKIIDDLLETHKNKLATSFFSKGKIKNLQELLEVNFEDEYLMYDFVFFYDLCNEKDFKNKDKKFANFANELQYMINIENSSNDIYLNCDEICLLNLLNKDKDYVLR